MRKQKYVRIKVHFGLLFNVFCIFHSLSLSRSFQQCFSLKPKHIIHNRKLWHAICTTEKWRASKQEKEREKEDAKECERWLWAETSIDILCSMKCAHYSLSKSWHMLESDSAFNADIIGIFALLLKSTHSVICVSKSN